VGELKQFQKFVEQYNYSFRILPMSWWDVLLAICLLQQKCFQIMM